jgi:hypothetical protein
MWGIMADDKKITGASYIIQFYQQVMSLNQYYSLYLNQFLYMDNKYGNDWVSSAEEMDKNAMLNNMQNLRYVAHNCFIQFQAILLDLGKSPDPKLTEVYYNIRNNFNINRAEMELFVIGVNSFLVKDTIRNLVTTSQDLIDSVFSHESKPVEQPEYTPDFAL